EAEATQKALPISGICCAQFAEEGERALLIGPAQEETPACVEIDPRYRQTHQAEADAVLASAFLLRLRVARFRKGDRRKEEKEGEHQMPRVTAAHRRALRVIHPTQLRTRGRLQQVLGAVTVGRRASERAGR